VKTQKDYYRAGDEFRVNLKAWNPGVARMANLYISVTCRTSRAITCRTGAS